MTLVRILSESEDRKTRLGFTNAESAIEKDGGVQVTFEEDTDRWGREHFFIGYRLVAVGR